MASFVKSKKLSHRKKPKSNDSWTSTSTKLASQGDSGSAQQSSQPFDITSTYERTRMYEQKYQHCMTANTSLSSWIKNIQDKGLPTPLIEGYYIPPPLTKSSTRSRLPDMFSSLSTRAHTSTTTANKRRSSVEPKRQQKIIQQQHQEQQQRFSFTSSLNRFSLPKNSSYISMTDKYHSVKSESTTKNNSATRQRNRFSSPPPLPNSHHHHYQNQRKQQYNISPPELIQTSNMNLADLTLNKKTLSAKRRPQSTILPHSPSSIFLDRLRSRNSNNTCFNVIEEKELMIQQHSSKQDVYFPHIYTIVDNYVEEMTPPSSPSSTDSGTTPPSLISSTTVTTHGSDQPSRENQTPLKKKRTSLLVSPSLSTIRLISQKSQFLKRSSMMST